MKSRNQGLGLSLIVIGGFLLFLKLNNTFYFLNFEMPFTFGELFRNIVNLWPVTLIFIGLNILFNRHTMFKMVLWVSFIVVLVLYTSYGSRFERIQHFIDPFDYHDDVVTEKEVEEKTIDMENAIKGKLKVDLNACSFKVREIESNSMRIKNNINALKVSNEYDEVEDIMTIKVEEGNDSEALDTKDSLKDIVIPFFSDDQSDKNRFTDIYLSNQMPWDIITEVNAVNANLNLKEISLEALDIDVNAGNVKLYLGDESTKSNIYINGGASNIKIYVPEDCGIRIIKKGNLVNFSDHFGLKEDLTTDNYNDAESTFDIYLNANALNVALYTD